MAIHSSFILYQTGVNVYFSSISIGISQWKQQTVRKIGNAKVVFAFPKANLLNCKRIKQWVALAM